MDPRPIVLLISLLGGVAIFTILMLTDDQPCSTGETKALSLPLTTGEVGGRVVVVDSAGERVKLACVNWYGAHMEGYVVNGLDTRSAADIANTIANLGFNCVRLPFSLEQFYDDPVVEPDRVSADPSLANMSSMEVFDATVAALTSAGLMVILNNHNSAAGWCCSEQDGEGLWYTHDYPEEMWLQALEKMVDRYVGNQLVVGMDLRNELRKAHGHSPR
jgi:endoglucanase